MKGLMVSKYTLAVAHNQNLRMALVVFLPLMLIIGLGIGLFFGHHHKPNNPKLPILQIQHFSATALSKSIPATWNLTVSVTNPNGKHLTLYISALTLTPFYYPSNRENDTDHVPFVKPVKLTPPVLEVEAKNTLFLSPLVFTLSAHTFGVPIADQIIKDQASGRVEAGFGGAVAFSYGKKKNVKAKGISTSGVLTVAGFQNHGGGSLVSQLPMSLVFFDLLF